MTDTDNSKIVDDQHPYLGLDSFREKYSKYFFGRSNEIDKLYSLVRNNVVTIFFGSSGLGKTSLLKAGLFPKLRENYYLPIYIRINFDDKLISPIEQTKTRIFNRIKKIDETVKPFNSLTLWEYFHQLKILDDLAIPLLVFDQFEEIFTLGKKNKKQINDFITEITDLIENQVPVSVQEKFEKQVIPFSFQDQKYRVIFSLREDYLPYLEKLNDLIPSIKKSRFRVLQLNRDQAFEATTLPGKNLIESSEAQTILDLIVAETSRSKDITSQDQEFEPFLLSLICEKINEKRLKKHEQKITENVIKEVPIKGIIKNLYEDNTTELEKIAIEEYLLTIEGDRKLYPLSDIYSRYSEITNDNIQKLIKKRIIRQETRNNIVYIELIHDVLVPVVKESRDQRRKQAEDKKIEAELERRKQELEKEAKEEAEKRKQQLKIKHSHQIIILLSLLFSVIIFAALFILHQLNEEETQNAINKALFSEYEREKDPTLSLRLAEIAYKIDRNNFTIDQLLTAYQYGPYYDIIMQHEKGVKITEVSKDGQYILTTNFDNIARLWDLNNFKLKELKGHKEPVTISKFSPNGKYIVTASEDYTARVWNLNGDTLRVLKDHKDIINHAEFSPDGKYVITASNDKKARLWEWEKNESAEVISHTDIVNIAKFSPDGKYIVTGSRDKTAKVYNLDSRRLIWTIRGLNESVEEIEFSHTGDSFATITESGIVRLWNISGRELPLSKELDRKINLVQFAPNLNAIITVSDATFKLWYLFGGEQRPLEFKGHLDRINSIEFSANGQFIITACRDKTAILWDLKAKQKMKKKLLGHQEAVLSAHFIGNDLDVVTTSFDRTSRIWKLDRGESQIFESGGGRCGGEQFGLIVNAPEERYVFSTNPCDYTVHLLSQSGKDTLFLKGHKNVVSSVVYSYTGKSILTTSTDSTVRLWDRNGDSLGIINVGEVKSAEFSEDEKYIITIGKDRTAKIWDRKGKLKYKPIGLNNFINSAKFSPDGKYVIMTVADSTVRLWEPIKNNLRIFNKADFRVNSAKFSTDGNQIIIAFEDSTARLYDLEGNEIRKFKGDERTVKSVHFSPKDNLILIHSEQYSRDEVRLWDSEEGNVIHKFTKEDMGFSIIKDVGFSKSGDYVIILYTNRTFWKWPINPDLILDLIDNEEKNNLIWKLDSLTQKKYGIQ